MTQTNFQKAIEQTNRELEAHGIKPPSVIPLEVRRIMKQRFEESEREKGKMEAVTAITLLVQKLPMFSEEEKQSLHKLLKQWLRDIAPSYDDYLAEIEDEDDV